MKKEDIKQMINAQIKYMELLQKAIIDSHNHTQNLIARINKEEIKLKNLKSKLNELNKQEDKDNGRNK